MTNLIRPVLLSIVILSSLADAVSAQQATSVIVKSSNLSSNGPSARKHKVILMDDHCQPTASNAKRSGADEELPDPSKLVIGPDIFSKGDASLAMSSAYQHQPDGSIKMTELNEGPEFSPHNQAAWQLMHEGSNMERRAILYKKRNDQAHYSYWHTKACEQLKKARAELFQHLASVQKGKSKSPPFLTYLNLAYCSALSGDSKTAMEEYSKYRQTREEFWTMPYGQFKLAVIFMQSQKTLSLARSLLKETVLGGDSKEPIQWGEYNNDKEYRIITWFVISDIEKAQGNWAASEKSREQAEKLLRPIANKSAGELTSAEFVKKALKRVREFDF